MDEQKKEHNLRYTTYKDLLERLHMTREGLLKAVYVAFGNLDARLFDYREGLYTAPPNKWEQAAKRDPHNAPAGALGEFPEVAARRVPVNAEAETLANTVPVHYVRPGGGGSYANVRVSDLAAVAMEAVALDPPRNCEYSNNGAWARLRKAFEMDQRRYAVSSQADGFGEGPVS